MPDNNSNVWQKGTVYILWDVILPYSSINIFSKFKLCEILGIHVFIYILTSKMVEITNATSNSRNRK